MDYTVSGRKLLFIEDDEKLKREMVEYFSPANAVFTASDVEDAVGILMRTGDVDAVVLDLILKSSMGIDLFKAFAALPPVIILSSLDGEENVMAGAYFGRGGLCDQTMFNAPAGNAYRPAAAAQSGRGSLVRVVFR